MVKIYLYKNDELVLTKEGKKEDNEYVFGNIVYNYDNHTLIREDASFRYLLDFKNNSALVLIKEQNFSLDLEINTLSIKENDKYLKVEYVIESDDKIHNTLKIEL